MLGYTHFWRRKERKDWKGNKVYRQEGKVEDENLKRGRKRETSLSADYTHGLIGACCFAAE